MKKTIPLFFLVITSLILISSFITIKSNSPTQKKIENTFKSVSLMKDTVGVNSKQLFTDFKKVNNAIAEIGYPDAGYQIWEVKNENAEFRYMIEGHWPDMETYRKIHSHQLYKKSISIKSESFKALKQTWYYRFDKIK